jgi:hypothetical protein
MNHENAKAGGGDVGSQSVDAIKLNFIECPGIFSEAPKGYPQGY